MYFELTDALVDDILFSMEDQEGVFFLDTAEGVVAGGADYIDIPDDDDGAENGGETGPRYIPLPEWYSASGFRLMERFAAGFRNPLVREELSAALGRGKGVFRAFKNTLGRYPEAEKLWFSFKEKEMKREILRWYNGLREEWGLEKIGGEPEDTGDLVLEDFRFRPLRDEDSGAVEELRRRCFEEYKQALVENGMDVSAGVLAGEPRAGGVLFDAGENALPRAGMAAESGGGEFSGYVSGVIHDGALSIQNLEVKAEYRGLGVGEALLVRFLESLNRNEVLQVFIDLPSWSEGFSRVLLRESFKPYTVRYWLDLRSRDGG